MAKRKHEEHENLERWLVSYADFITLLFAFFVVMYSISSLNEGRFRTVSDSIKAALNPVGPTDTSALVNIGQSRPRPRSERSEMKVPIIPGSIERAVARLHELVKAKQEESDSPPVHMIEKEDGDIVIIIPDQVLFKSGEATIRQEAFPFLKGLAGAMLELNRHVRIEGHTDNVPIRTAQFPSNWELSVSRAVMVVRVLSELYGVPPNHFVAMGYAETRPLTANLDSDQRAKNRRVEVVILDKDPVLPTMSVETHVSSQDRASTDPEIVPEPVMPRLVVPPPSSAPEIAQ